MRNENLNQEIYVSSWFTRAIYLAIARTEAGVIL